MFKSYIHFLYTPTRIFGPAKNYMPLANNLMFSLYENACCVGINIFNYISDNFKSLPFNKLGKNLFNLVIKNLYDLIKLYVYFIFRNSNYRKISLKIVMYKIEKNKPTGFPPPDLCSVCHV